MKKKINYVLNVPFEECVKVTKDNVQRKFYNELITMGTSAKLANALVSKYGLAGYSIDKRNNISFYVNKNEIEDVRNRYIDMNDVAELETVSIFDSDFIDKIKLFESIYKDKGRDIHNILPHIGVENFEVKDGKFTYYINTETYRNRLLKSVKELIDKCTKCTILMYSDDFCIESASFISTYNKLSLKYNLIIASNEFAYKCEDVYWQYIERLISIKCKMKLMYERVYDTKLRSLKSIYICECNIPFKTTNNDELNDLIDKVCDCGVGDNDTVNNASVIAKIDEITKGIVITTPDRDLKLLTEKPIEGFIAE